MAELHQPFLVSGDLLALTRSQRHMVRQSYRTMRRANRDTLAGRVLAHDLAATLARVYDRQARTLALAG